MSTRDFLHVFRGNRAAVGLDDAGHGAPGPLRLPVPDERETAWLALCEGHLAGHMGIGVYPYNHVNGSVAWGCVDFDEGEVESWSHALNLRAVLHDCGLTAWIERSRSKGYHVWLFSEWVTARWMRQLLIGACHAADAPAREVNPKSEVLAPGQLGNFVRLPYFGTATGRITRQVIVDLLGNPLDVALFVHEALEGTATGTQVHVVANRLYEPPAPVQRAMVDVDAGPWQDRLNGLARVQLNEGPKGSDRSLYLAAFGYACAESGLSEREIVKAVRVADLLHTHKYAGRRDAQDRYGDIARRSMTAVATGAPPPQPQPGDAA